MRVLHLISSNGLFGAERVVLELSKGLSALKRCDPVVGALRNSQNPHTEILEEARSNGLGTAMFPCAGQFDARTINGIRNFLKKEAIDLLHCHGYKSNFYGLLAAGNLVPKVTTNHNWLLSHWKLKLYCLLDALWIRRFDRIVAVSEEVKRNMLKYRVPEEKIEVIDNGIDVNRLNREFPAEEARAEFGLKGQEKVIGTVGSLKPEKGHIYLLRAAKEALKNNPDLKFLLVGDGPLRRSLESEAIDLGIERNLIFAGERSDIGKMLSLMDIFILPSVEEGLPMALLEAMAAKKPIVATAVGAVPRVIEHNRDGLLVAPRDSSGLGNAVLTLVNDEGKRNELADKAYERVKGSFSCNRMGERYYSLYESLLS